MPQVFINSRSELVKGSHKRPYVTLLCLPVSGLFGKVKIQSSKALRRAMRKWCSRGEAGFKTSGIEDWAKSLCNYKEIFQSNSRTIPNTFYGIGVINDL